MLADHSRRLVVLTVVFAFLAAASAPVGVAAAAGDEPLSSGVSSLPTAKPEEVGMSAARLARIDPVMQGYVDRREVAGAVALVARRGRVVYLKAFGDRDAEADSPMTADTIFRIASMTKPITSVALMMLYEEGRFQLRDPISRWLPAFGDMKVAVPAGPAEYVGEPYKLVPALRPITIQHLLTHTAGLANNYRGVTRDLYRQLGEQRQPGDTVADFVERLAELPLNFQPGDAWEYGPATTVVGRLVEVMSGMTLDEFFERRIFAPLGMEDTHFYLPEEKLERFAALYRPGEGGRIELAEAPSAESRWVREPHVYFNGAGGLVSTAADYFRFQQMMLAGGELDGVRLLGPKTVELMTVNHIGDLETWLRGPGYGFGLGYSVVTDLGLSAAPASLGSYAWGGAFCTSFWVDPREEVIGILMTQVRPYTHLNIRQDLASLAYQAIVD